MQGASILLMLTMMGAGGDYVRSLAADRLDQATLDAEGYGETKSIKREADGLRIVVAPGEKETGWKTPQQLRFGGNFKISANVVITKLPKPAQEDGAAFGMAIAFQDITQPDATLLRMLEPKGPDIYRTVEKAGANPQMQAQMQMQMQMMQMGGAPAKPPKLPRPTFPAAGNTVRMQLEREGNTLRFEVTDAATGRSRYLGQTQLNPMDVMAIKLFATNRNGAEAINVLFRDLTVQADRVNGLGTIVRTVYNRVIYADPTSIENGVLILGGQPKAPAGPNPAQPGTAPQAVPQPTPPPGVLPANVMAGAVAMRVAVAGQPNGPVQVFAVALPVAPAVQVAAAPAEAKQEEAKPVEKKETEKKQEAPKTAPAKPRTKAESIKQAFEQPFAGGMPTKVAAGQPAPPPPKAKIPLDELASIKFERTPGMSARVMGQPNLDFTMPGLSAKKNEPPAKDAPKKPAEADDVLAPAPGTTIINIPKVEPKKNGIRDLDIALFGLRDKAIKQVTVMCQTDKGPASWRLDTSGSEDWPLVVVRTGNEMTADLFLEPPAGDVFQKDFNIMLMYEDNQNGNVNAKSEIHSDPKLAFDPKASSTPRLDAWVHLTGDEKLFGTIENVGPDALKITVPWKDHLDVPWARVAGVHFGVRDRKESRESFAKRLAARGSEDVLLAQTKDGEVVAIPGIVEGSEGDRLKFQYEGKTRTIPLKQVEGLIMAARPERRTSDEPQSAFTLPEGVVVSGRWKDIDTSVWKIVTAWGQVVNLPAAEVLEVRFRGGKVTYLSDLKPSKVEETPYFGHRLPFKSDVSLLGEPLKVGGQTFDRGVAVHSRCVLTYDLNGRFSRFETLVGFDEAARGKGRVDCRVFVDGKEVYANADLRADGPPVKLNLPVAGADQLRLHVDYGRGQDTGDRVIWADARLYRETPGSAASITAPPAPLNLTSGAVVPTGRR
jgi:hypothetical protein